MSNDTNVRLDKQAFEEIAEFRYRVRKFLRFSETAARKVGITPHQHQLLLAIQGYPGRDYATPAELAERLQLKHNSCLGLISRCEEAKLVRRFDNPDDRRSVYVTLTARGLSLLEQLTCLHCEELAHYTFPTPSIPSHESTHEESASSTASDVRHKLSSI